MFSTTLRVASRTQAFVAVRPHQAAIISSVRFISKSPMTAEGASKQGMGEASAVLALIKKSIKGENPVTARAETAKNAVKSVASGVKGAAQKATGQGEAKTDAMDVAGKNEIEQQVERGRKEGIAKKGDEQAAPK
ncbi:hypothetical protein JCM3766R1_006010 [Sporobolomyces carnicolor]